MCNYMYKYYCQIIVILVLLNLLSCAHRNYVFIRKQEQLSYDKNKLLKLEPKKLEAHFNHLTAHAHKEKVLADIDILLTTNLSDDIWSIVIKTLMQNHEFTKSLNLARNPKDKAYILAKIGHALKAAQAYEEYQYQSIKKADIASACFFKGFSLYEASLYHKALDNWSHCLHDVKDTDYFEAYLWYQALSNILIENYLKASLQLKDLIKQFHASKDIEKYQYFLAWTLINMHHINKAKNIWQNLVEKSYLGYYQILSRQALNLDMPEKNQAYLKSFPQIHYEHVAKVSKEYDLNPYLVYGIIKTESNFNIQAISNRGAQGLMQVMPFWAQKIKHKLKHDKINLIDPNSALLFGMYTLAMLHYQFDQDYLVIAAYNAGAHQVKKWQNSFGYLPYDLFIERIPFKETREYIKKVVASKTSYQILYAH